MSDSHPLIFLTQKPSANADIIVPTSYTYGANAESQPQPTTFQGGSISDVGNVKLNDDVLASGSWNDGTNVGFRNDFDNGNPQPRVTFDLNGLFDVATVDVYSVLDFLTINESVSISSSTDNSTFSTPVVVNQLVWTGGFTNDQLIKLSVDVSSLPDGQYIRLDFFDPIQWMMINEIDFDSTSAVPEPSSLALFGLGSVMMLVRRRRG